MRGLLHRAIRPPPPDEPNANDPASVPPATVGPPSARPGDPHGVVVEAPAGPAIPPPRVVPSAWSGWPAEWGAPYWQGHRAILSDTAWIAIDKNASNLSAMPPYLVGAPSSLDASWLANPNPDLYSSWEEFAKSLFWDYHLGEAFLIATARYSSGYPARFHVVPPWAVNVEMDGGRRRYSIGRIDVSDRILHIRYQGSVDDAHGHGPLEAVSPSIVAEDVLARYATGFAEAGGVPPSLLVVDEELTADQSAGLQAQWVAARRSRIGEPAVLSGGVKWEATGVNPADAGAHELLAQTRSRIAVALGVPPFLMGLPSGGDPMTYANVTAIFDYHWRDGLRPKAQAVMSALSGWLLPRGTSVELNRDAYVADAPLARAQTVEILHRIGALSIDEIRELERVAVSGALGLSGPAPAAPPAAPMIEEVE